VVGIFPNKASCLRYSCLRLTEIDEEWQTGRKYMKMPEKDQESNQNDTLLREIKQIKKVAYLLLYFNTIFLILAFN